MRKWRKWNLLGRWTATAPDMVFWPSRGGLTMREAARVFQLDPQPPEAGTLNDYITAALRERNLDYFSFFLHHYEARLNGRVFRFLMREGLERYDPERFLDYKRGCVLAMLDCLPG